MIETYKVIWFEDDHDWFIEERDKLGDLLEAEYRLKIEADHHAKPSDMTSDALEKQPDLILVDFNYDKNDKTLKGHDIIKEFQARYPFTTVVFYSADKDFQSTLSTQFEGVYFANRLTLFSKVTILIEKSMKNVFSIKNLRSYVISEVAELDTYKVDTLAKLLSRTDLNIPAVNLTLYEKVMTNRVGRIKTLRKKLKAANFTDINATKLLLTRLDAEDRNNAIRRYDDIFDVIKTNDALLVAYQPDVLKKRNILAHCQEAIDENGNVILKNDIDAATPHTFDKEGMLNLRDKIMTYRKLFKSIHAKVHEQN